MKMHKKRGAILFWVMFKECLIPIAEDLKDKREVLSEYRVTRGGWTHDQPSTDVTVNM
jgi:hypothetical protein